MVEKAQYTDEQHTSIRAVIDGREIAVPADESNRHYRMIQEAVGAGDLTIAEPDQPTAAEVEARSLSEIDQAASRARARFISSGVGQSAVYLTKYEEARAYKAASSPTDIDYPYLKAEASRRGMTLSNLADEIIATRNKWTDPPGATIEAERVGGKADVRAASTVTDKEAARDNAIAALDAIQPQ